MQKVHNTPCPTCGAMYGHSPACKPLKAIRALGGMKDPEYEAKVTRIAYMSRAQTKEYFQHNQLTLELSEDVFRKRRELKIPHCGYDGGLTA